MPFSFTSNGLFMGANNIPENPKQGYLVTIRDADFGVARLEG